MLRLIFRDNEKIIFKVKNLTNLDIAKHPYLNNKMEYITYYFTNENLLNIVNKDGSSWSVSRGTLCAKSVDLLRSKVIEQIRNLNINPYTGKGA